jgi:hypothetical protein
MLEGFQSYIPRIIQIRIIQIRFHPAARGIQPRLISAVISVDLRVTQHLVIRRSTRVT